MGWTASLDVTPGRLLVSILLATQVCAAVGATSPASPRSQAPQVAAAQRLLTEGRGDEAETLLRAELVQRSAPDLHYWLGVCLVERYDYAGAEAELLRATSHDSRRVDWLFLLAEVQQQRGRFVAAAATLEQCLALDPEPRYRFALGLCSQRGGRLDDAEREFRLTLKQRPKHAEALYRLAELLGDRGQFEEALELLVRCVELRPRHVDARFRLGLSLEKLGRRGEALSTFETVLSEVPSHLGALYNCGRALLAEGRGAEGRARLEEFRRVGFVADEIQHLQAVLKHAPEDVDRRLALIGLMLDVGKLAEAEQQLGLCRGFAPGRAELHRLTERLAALQDDGEGVAAAALRAARLESRR